MTSDEQPLLTLPSDWAGSGPRGAFDLRREGGGCAWRAELVELAAEFAAIPDQRARVPDERVSE